MAIARPQLKCSFLLLAPRASGASAIYNIFSFVKKANKRIKLTDCFSVAANSFISNMLVSVSVMFCLFLFSVRVLPPSRFFLLFSPAMICKISNVMAGEAVRK